MLLLHLLFSKWYLWKIILDLHLEIDSECWLRTKLRQERWFRFPIVNFPFIGSDIPVDYLYITNPVLSQEWGKDQIVITTNETYPWSFVTQIFHSGQPSYDGDRKIFEVTKFNPATLYWSGCSHETEWSYMSYICVTGINFASIYTIYLHWNL
jgi:hypothetical protein